MVFLSFNTAITPADDIGGELDDADDGEEVPSTLRLRHKWVIWKQLMSTGTKAMAYGESTKQIATCETVEEFWRTWDRLPQPSELLTKRMVLNVADGFHILDALMVFREGVLPQWEDVANADGGHFQFQLKASLGKGQIDEYWNNLILGIIGGCIDPVDMITGVRLVDKLGAGRSNSTGNIRVEVWFNDIKRHKAVQTLQRNIERCLATKTLEGRIGLVPKAELKNHKLTRHQ
ncbi:unnamed protein product [Polarella glacialis]|uniref:Eukaryotic translation initiation factor 4E n=1 Tax=Polarella glacialis TaxID=89957 RepID=A0A813LKR2_POLGL|nr:unnamed protein product [Polarella glacialis]CAE8736531.1 unnamed protein product [Polarella glacialis]